MITTDFYTTQDHKSELYHPRPEFEGTKPTVSFDWPQMSAEIQGFDDVWSKNWCKIEAQRKQLANDLLSKMGGAIEEIFITECQSTLVLYKATRGELTDGWVVARYGVYINRSKNFQISIDQKFFENHQEAEDLFLEAMTFGKGDGLGFGEHLLLNKSMGLHYSRYSQRLEH